MVKVGIINESQYNNSVVLTPSYLKQMNGEALFFVQSGTGKSVGYSDQDYRESGAQIIHDRTPLVYNSDLILSFSEVIYPHRSDAKKDFANFININDYQLLLPYMETLSSVYLISLLKISKLSENRDVASAYFALFLNHFLMNHNSPLGYTDEVLDITRVVESGKISHIQIHRDIDLM